MSAIRNMRRLKVTTPRLAPGGTDPLRSPLGCSRYVLLECNPWFVRLMKNLSEKSSNFDLGHEKSWKMITTV